MRATKEKTVDVKRIVEAPPPPGDRYLSVKLLCDKLTRKRTWIYKQMAEDPTFPRARYIGKSPRFPESEVDMWVLLKSERSAELGRPSRRTPKN